MNRREFITKSVLTGAAAMIAPKLLYSNQTVLTSQKYSRRQTQGELIFKPYYVQKSVGPNLLDWAYASDNNWDAFYSNITATKEGVKISDTNGHDRFGIDVRWNVEGFGYIYITADNGGEYYNLPALGKTEYLNLNYELAKSRVIRNRKRLKRNMINGWQPERDTKAFIDISEEYFSDAQKHQNQNELCAVLSETALYYAMQASEKIELEKAQYDILKTGYRPGFFIGCDARGYFQMDPDLFLELFPQAFNYATITHYLVSKSYQDFEPQEDEEQFNLRTVLFKELRNRKITVEGRPLFWFYKTVTPDWLRNMSYDKLKKYIERHAKEVVSHYGNEMYAWEVVNEAHDWANELQLSPDQIVDVTKLACEIVKEVNPKIHRLINNCCPFAEYVQLRKWGDIDAKYPQRTPIEFMKALVEAGVDFTVAGQQMYFPFRDLSDIIILLERFEQFGKPVQLTEVGASSGPNVESVNTGRLGISTEPFAWHGQWTEELQADWLEGVYTLAYSKPWIEAVNWYDFVDPFSWIKGGGLISSPNGEKKLAFTRLIELQKKWKNLGKS